MGERFGWRFYFFGGWRGFFFCRVLIRGRLRVLGRCGGVEENIKGKGRVIIGVRYKLRVMVFLGLGGLSFVMLDRFVFFSFSLFVCKVGIGVLGLGSEGE